MLPPPAQRSSRNDRAAERSSGTRSSAAASGRCKSKGHGRFAATLGCPRTGAGARRSFAPSRGGRRRAPRTACAQRCCRFCDRPLVRGFGGRLGAVVVRQRSVRPPLASSHHRPGKRRKTQDRQGPEATRCVGEGRNRERRGSAGERRWRWRERHRQSGNGATCLGPDARGARRWQRWRIDPTPAQRQRGWRERGRREQFRARPRRVAGRKLAGACATERSPLRLGAACTYSPVGAGRLALDGGKLVRRGRRGAPACGRE